MMETSIVIAAAGASRRMGGEDKLMRIVDGVPLIRRTALRALSSGHEVLVTLRPGDNARRDALAGLSLRMLSVEDAATGLSASLRRAATEVEAEAGLMVLPADMPEIGAGDLARFRRARAAHPDRILRAMAGDHPGHPVAFPPDIVPELRTLSGDTGARAVLAQYDARVLPVPLFGRRAVLDLDTPQDWTDWSSNRPSIDTPLDALANPLSAALNDPQDCVLAVITAVHGSGWRRPGAMMCLWRDHRAVGQLTGGCIEADLALHAGKVLDDGRPLSLRYGAGSPFFDIRLPCGGGLDITLFPFSDTQALADLECLRRARASAGLRFQPDGEIRLDLTTPTGWDGKDFVVARKPEIRFLVLGRGEEARFFTHLARSAGYSVLNTDQAEVEAAFGSGGSSNRFGDQDMLLLADERAAVLTFFHEHESEVGIIASALRGPAFYVGALGSRRVAAQRLSLLHAVGIDRDLLERLHAPIGLIPSRRDPRELAISILAEIIAVAGCGCL
ncbi:NTP transferase domain-containing protein [Agrobacterium pusense]|uniref:NTP transferase domain-containing protein n=1 Tax=Agrobacterium pusense TaxID=648995 RepID=UPI0028980BB5|nr:NTP transferase domain-containing protein [Agrobacterium pusense]